MKLALSLPERPGLLHAVPVVDLMLLLWLVFFLSSALTRQSGMKVELPPSRFQLERYPDTHVVTLGHADGKPRIHFGRDAVSTDQLSAKLDALHAQGAAARSMVLLQTDAGTPVGIERQIAEMILAKGFRLAVVGAGMGEMKPKTPDAPQ